MRRYVKSQSKCLFSSLGDDGDEGAVFTTFLELDGTVAKSKEGMVFTHSDILTRIVDGATLTNDDVTGDAMLTTKDFNT